MSNKLEATFHGGVTQEFGPMTTPEVLGYLTNGDTVLVTKQWGVRSAEGVVSVARDEATARKWAGYLFTTAAGSVGETLVCREPGREWCEVCPA